LQVRDQELSVVSTDLATIETVLVATRRQLSKLKDVISAVQASRDRLARDPTVCLRRSAQCSPVHRVQWEQSVNVQLERGNHSLAARALRAGADAAPRATAPFRRLSVRRGVRRSRPDRCVRPDSRLLVRGPGQRKSGGTKGHGSR
jgi:hypothetical protein